VMSINHIVRVQGEGNLGYLLNVHLFLVNT